MNDIYYQKYLKYKSKYLELQKISGSGSGKSGYTIPIVREPKVNIDVLEMNNYDKNNNNVLKQAIITFIDRFINPLSDEQKKNLDIPEIPENHDDLQYTDVQLTGFQLFRYKIYLLLFKKIEVNLDNFKKTNNLIYNKLYLYSGNSIFTLTNINKLFDFEKDIFNKILKLKFHTPQLGELLALNLDINDLNKFLELNLPENETGCPKSKCDNSSEIINWIRSKPQNSLKNLLTYDFDTIRNSITKKDGTFLRLISNPNPKIK
jgi:hypothetical protein